MTKREELKNDGWTDDELDALIYSVRSKVFYFILTDAMRLRLANIAASRRWEPCAFVASHRSTHESHT